jgi:hypothetical protein
VPHRHSCRYVFPGSRKQKPNVDTLENTSCEVDRFRHKASGLGPDGPIDNRSAGRQPAPHSRKHPRRAGGRSGTCPTGLRHTGGMAMLTELYLSRSAMRSGSFGTTMG